MLPNVACAFDAPRMATNRSSDMFIAARYFVCSNESTNLEPTLTTEQQFISRRIIPGAFGHIARMFGRSYRARLHLGSTLTVYFSMISSDFCLPLEWFAPPPPPPFPFLPLPDQTIRPLFFAEPVSHARAAACRCCWPRFWCCYFRIKRLESQRRPPRPRTWVVGRQ